MKIRLLAFASAADALGAAELELELPAGSRVADLADRLRRDHPGIAPIWSRLAVALDGELVADDDELADGAEVALLPPVSGGARRPAQLTDAPLDPAALLAEVADTGCGAALLFLGRVRDRHRGREVVGITYHAYRPMALSALQRITRELEAATPGLRLAIAHRLGKLPVGEASVAIAAASPHRAAAYEASRVALERLKREAPIWKREHYADGDSAWREEEPLAPVAG